MVQNYTRMFQAHFVGLEFMKQRAALKDNTRKLVDECGAKDTLYKPPQAPMAKKDYTNICSATRKSPKGIQLK